MHGQVITILVFLREGVIGRGLQGLCGVELVVLAAVQGVVRPPEVVLLLVVEGVTAVPRYPAVTDAAVEVAFRRSAEELLR